MGMNLLKLQLVYYNFSYKAPLIKIFLLATLMAAIPCFNLLVQIDMINGCDWSFPVPPISRVDANSTVQETSNFPVNVTAVFEMLLQEGWLKRGDRAVCVGPGSAAAVMAMRRMGVRGSFGTCGMRGGDKSLPFGDNWAEFVYSEALERVRVPARLVMEMERVLRPGRVGVIFQAGTMGRAAGPRTATMLIKAAVPVSSFLRFSDVVGVREVNSSALVIFRKRGSPAAGPTGKTLRRVTLPAQLVASS